jgi:hypothetical protein
VPRVDPADRHRVDEEADGKEEPGYAAFVPLVVEPETLGYQ